jgi:hypothetical protein
MTGPGASTSIVRTYQSGGAGEPGSLLFQNQASMTVIGYGGFSAAVSSTGDLHDYSVGLAGTVGPNIGADARASIWDVVTVSGASGGGTLRMSWHVTGNVDVGWSVNGPVEVIDHSVVRLSFGCFAQPVGSTIPDTCPDPTFTWTTSVAVDEIVSIDMPIVFGSPVQYQLAISLRSDTATGHYTDSGGLVSFSGHAVGGFGSTGTLVGAEILDSFGQPVAGGTIESESGFQYGVVPEPARAALLAFGSLVLAAARWQREGSGARKDSHDGYGIQRSSGSCSAMRAKSASVASRRSS